MSKMRFIFFLFLSLLFAFIQPIHHTAPSTSFLENFIFIQFIFAFQNSIKLKSLKLGAERARTMVDVLALKLLSRRFSSFLVFSSQKCLDL